MDLGLTWFDFAALAVLALSGVMAFARGLIREVFSIIAFIGGVLAAIFFRNMLAPLVEQFTPLSGLLAVVAAALIIFLIVFIVITVAVSTLAKSVHQSTEIGSFDRAGGLAFGILRGIIAVAVFFVLPLRYAQTTDPNGRPDPIREDIQNARTYPMYESVAVVLEAVLPVARERAGDLYRREKGESASIPPAAPAAEPAPEQGQAPN